MRTALRALAALIIAWIIASVVFGIAAGVFLSRPLLALVILVGTLALFWPIYKALWRRKGAADRG